MKIFSTRERIKSKTYEERKQDTGREREGSCVAQREEIREETILSKETLSDELRLKLVD